jgi:hypothetical protein
LHLALAGSSRRPRPPRRRRRRRHLDDPPRLVVLVVIDQWPSWGVAERRAHYRAGLARLLDGGVHFARAQYPFAITFTSPGHAALGTGASPRVTGVVANTWFRRGDGVERAAEHDPASPVLGLGGERLPIDGASGAILAVDGLAEALRAGTGGRGRSVAIAGKARAACFVAGRRPDVALWYEPAAQAMTSRQRRLRRAARVGAGARRRAPGGAAPGRGPGRCPIRR